MVTSGTIFSRFATIEFIFLINGWHLDIRDVHSIMAFLWKRNVSNIALFIKHKRSAFAILIKLLSFTTIVLFPHFSSSLVSSFSWIKEGTFVMIGEVYSYRGLHSVREDKQVRWTGERSLIEFNGTNGHQLPHVSEVNPDPSIILFNICINETKNQIVGDIESFPIITIALAFIIKIEHYTIPCLNTSYLNINDV